MMGSQRTQGAGIASPALESQMLFTSLGLVVLDEIRLPSSEILHDVIGASGAYSKSLSE